MSGGMSSLHSDAGQSTLLTVPSEILDSIWFFIHSLQWTCWQERSLMQFDPSSERKQISQLNLFDWNSSVTLDSLYSISEGMTSKGCSISWIPRGSQSDSLRMGFWYSRDTVALANPSAWYDSLFRNSCQWYSITHPSFSVHILSSSRQSILSYKHNVHCETKRKYQYLEVLQSSWDIYHNQFAINAKKSMKCFFFFMQMIKKILLLKVNSMVSQMSFTYYRHFALKILAFEL